MPTREFGAKVPEELYEEFRDLFPMYGATTWFITHSLEQFVKLARQSPQLQEMVAASIDQMLQERREQTDEL